MDGALRRRALAASVWSATVVGGAAVLCGACFLDRLALLSIVLGTLVLGPAQLLRAAAVLRRGSALVPAVGLLSRLRGCAVALLSVAVTSLAMALLVAGFAGSDDEAHLFGALLGVASLVGLWPRGVLRWSSLPREAAHRRVKAKLLGTLLEGVLWSAVCLVLSAWIAGPSTVGCLAGRLLAGILVIVAGEAHAEALQSCASLAGGELPRSAELIEALAQPFSASPGGPGLGRWLALTALAQAAAHRSFGALCHRGTDGRGLRAGGGQGSLPPLAAEVFGLTKADGSRVAAGEPSGKDFAFGVPVPPALLQQPSSQQLQQLQDPQQALYQAQPKLQQPPQPQTGSGADFQGFGVQGQGDLGRSVGGGGRAAAYSSGRVPTGRGLFAAYLASSLEVVQEFGLRVQCLVDGPMRRPDAAATLAGSSAAARVALHSAAASVEELLPLYAVASAGISGWICLSRDLDEAGIVQREEALRKAICELCAVLVALGRVRPLRVAGVLELPAACAAALQEAELEARHGLTQLLLTFEHAGLREIQLPEEHQHFIADLCS